MKIPLVFLAASVLTLALSPLRAQVVADGATNTLSNVTNTFTGDVTVGTNGSFTLLVLSDNALLTNSANGVIGLNAAAKSNEVRLASPTGRWLMGGDLSVGQNGAFNRLVVSNGGLVRDATGTIGSESVTVPVANSNVVVVTGPGSLWNNTNNLYVGLFGVGNQLVVSNGATVSGRFGIIGGSGGSNAAVVTGSGSAWRNSQDLWVGQSGHSNRLTVSNGGLVVNESGVLGLSFNRGNETIVTGSGSLWSNRLDLTVGSFGAPGNRLVISNGGTVFVAREALIGAGAGSTNNRVTVDGGTLRATNASGSGVLEVRRGTNVLNAGLIDVDRLVLTNAGGFFDFKGGTLVTRGALVTNGAGIIIGAFGTNPAVWDVRPGVFDHVLANGVIVGNGSSSNQLLITGGAVLSNSISGFIGLGAGANSNAAFVSGAGSRWRVSGDIGVGNGGAFNRLTVSDGGWVGATSGRVGGSSASSNNVAMVTGAGSIWSNATSLSVGDIGPRNQLLVSDGGAVFAANGLIGQNTTASANTVSLSGAGSQWRMGSLEVGRDGSFNGLIVSDGALVSDMTGVVGNGTPGSNNVAMVAGAGSVWSNAASLSVGAVGASSQLLVSDGGAVFAGNGVIGQSASASASMVLVSDAGSQWRMTGNLEVGSGGSFNQLIVSDGALVTDLHGSIGNASSGSNNAVVVTGAGSVWNNAGTLAVGLFGRGNHLMVSNGGVVTAFFTDVGSSSANNQVIVTDPGSVLSNSDSLFVGVDVGTNRLVVKNGGRVEHELGFVGLESSSNAVTITGAGSLWSNRLDQSVGGTGSRNDFIVTDGGTAFTGGNGVIGQNTGANSNGVVVSDPRSRWLVTSNFLVGNQGAFNRLVVSNGGFVSALRGVVGSQLTASNNVALVTGPGSVWSNSITVVVGDRSGGNQLVVTNGGSLISGDNSVLGLNVDSDNNLAVVTGSGSSWLSAIDLIVGIGGSANHLVVSNGGMVVVRRDSVVGVSGHSNDVLVTGAGSLWSNRSNLVVGRTGNASRLAINNGGTVFGSSVFIGERSTNNRVVVDGGTLRATSATGTSVLDVRRGTNVLNAGLIDVDQLVLTNKGTIPIPLVFGNGSSINILDSGAANPYPSTIAVAGYMGAMTKVTVTLSNLTHGIPYDIDILLVSPAGQKVMLMSDAGSVSSISNVKLTFDDSAATSLPNTSAIVSGTYRPTDYGPPETMPAPAPGGPYSTNLSSFNGSSPNGVWSLYINDDTGGGSGSGNLVGWSVQIETDGGPFLDPGAFEFNGGTLVTRGAVIDNRVPFVVGGPGGVPAVWDVRAGASDHFVVSDLIVGSLPAGSSNNLLHVTGGTLNAGTLDIRGGTNRLDAGLVDVDRLVITNARGQFEFNGGTLRTPDTTVANGRVFTVGGGLSLATLQLLGGTHTFANNLLVASNGSLIGNGVIDGTVTVSAGGRLIPGAPIGRISVQGTVILQGAVNLQIDKSGGVKTNDQVTASGAIFYSGALNVTDIGTDLLAAGDRFPLFSAAPYVGEFTMVSLPPLGPGLAWMNNLSVDGSIAVVATGQPGFASISLSGTNVIIAGTNGTPNATYTVLAATNLALPLSNWVSIATKQFDASGRFSFTNAIVPGIPQRFFQLRTP